VVPKQTEEVSWNPAGVCGDDGTERWSYETGAWVKSSPAVIDDTVYVGSDDGSVYALSEQ